MKCEDVQALFSDYYDGETELVEEISLHLEGCSDCSKDYVEYYNMLAYVANIEEPDAPEGLHRALVSFADGFFRGRKKHISVVSHRFTSVFASLAAAAAAVLFVWFSGVFDTGAGAYDGQQMFFEFAMPHAAAEVFVEVYDDFHRERLFDLDDEAYDSPFARHYMMIDEFTGDEISGILIPEADDFVFFEPVFAEETVSPAIRPHFATAVIFLAIGMFLGLNVHRIIKHMERKSYDAP